MRKQPTQLNQAMITNPEQQNPAKHDALRSHPKRNAPSTQASSSRWESKGPNKQRIRNSTMGGSGSDQRGPGIRRLRQRGPRRRRGQRPARRRIGLPLLRFPPTPHAPACCCFSRSFCFSLFSSLSLPRGCFKIDSTPYVVVAAGDGSTAVPCVRARAATSSWGGEGRRRRAEMEITCCSVLLRFERIEEFCSGPENPKCAVSGRQKDN